MRSSNQSKIAVLGAGSWGTAIAIHLAHYGHHVSLWGHTPETIKRMKQSRENERYLPGIEFPKQLVPESNLHNCVTNADEVIIAVPSHAFAELLAQMPKPATGVSWLTKGLDPATHDYLSTLVANNWGKDFPVAAISGPSFAKEVAAFLPTALVVAGKPSAHLKSLRNHLHHGNIRVYLSADIQGVQLCGAVKNVLAIACGISDGLNYGANARAALITRGLAEMSRLGQHLGAHPETFTGLAGLGDLVLTCTDNQSRNRRFGIKLGQGENLDQAEKSIGQVVEGKQNAAQICSLAVKHAVEMPICQEVYDLIQGKMTAAEAVEKLMSRPPAHE